MPSFLLRSEERGNRFTPPFTFFSFTSMQCLLDLLFLDAIAPPSSSPVSGWVSDSFRCDAIASPSFASLFSIQLKMLSRSLPSAPTHHCMVTSIFQGRQTPLECSFLSFNKIYYLLCSFLIIITYKSPRNSNAAKLRLQVIQGVFYTGPPLKS